MANDHVDARIEATRARLRAALLNLATRKDVGAISVAELARAAGIDRSTFYSHARSPAVLLAEFLAEDLDPLRVAVEQTLDLAPQTLGIVGNAMNARLVDHVERYAAVYVDRGNGRINSALYAVLSNHTRASLEKVFTHLPAQPPLRGPSTSPLPADVDDRRYLAAFLAHGIIGTVSTWLAEPEPRDRRRLERALEVVYSAWLVPAAMASSSTAPITESSE